MNIQGIVISIVTIGTASISAYSLFSKTGLEKIFMTEEQKVIQKLFAYLLLIAYTTFLFPFLYVMWSIGVENKNIISINWNRVTTITILTFFISAFIVLVCIEKIKNFVIKEKNMYKVEIENIGELYLIKMLNKEICICTDDPHTDLESTLGKTILIKVEDLVKLPIIKEKFTLPPRSVYQKLLK